MGKGLRNVRSAYKNAIAVMRVSVPVTIMSLKESECIGIGEMLDLAYHCQGFNPVVCMCKVPKLIKPAITAAVASSMSCLREQRKVAFKPVPFIKSVGG